MDFCKADDGTFMGYPANKVIAVVNEPEQVHNIITELTDMGYHPDELEVLCGQAAAPMLDASGTHHGVLSQFVRFIQRSADLDAVLLRRYEEELHAHHFVLAVPVANRDMALNIRNIMKADGGHFINYYGQFSVELMAE